MAEKQKRTRTYNGTNKDIREACKKSGDYSNWKFEILTDVEQPAVLWFLKNVATPEQKEAFKKAVKEKFGANYAFNKIRSFFLITFFPKANNKPTEGKKSFKDALEEL